MKCCRYSDGTCSREVKEDWEATGQDEMNDIYASLKQNRRTTDARYPLNTPILNTQDRINNLKSLLVLCGEALSESKLYDIKEIVSSVIHFHIEPELDRIEEGLRNV